MHLFVTSQFARGEEKLIALFESIDHARLFLLNKSYRDDEEGKKIIYRLYKNQDLLQVWNKDNISISSALYADGISDFDNPSLCIFEVMINYINYNQRTPIAKFNVELDAMLFIISAFKAENDIHANDVFFIFKGQLLMHTVNKSILEKQKNGLSGTSNQDNSSKYQISPLSTRPTPSGGPPDYWVKKDDTEE